MPEFGLMIRGTKGTIKVDDDELVFALDSAQPPVLGTGKTLMIMSLSCWVSLNIFRENEHFIKSIIFNGKSEPNFQTATKVDYLLEQVRCKANE